MRIAFIITLLFIGFTSFAIQKIDSLKYELLNHDGEDIVKVEILNNLGYEYWIINPVQSIIYGQQARALAEILKDSTGLAFANRVIGVAHWARGSYDFGLEYLLDGLSIYESKKDTLGIGNCLMNIGLIYADRSDNELASKYYFDALNLFKKKEAHGRIATTYTKLATILIEEGKFEEAYDFLDRAGTIHWKNDFLYGMVEILNRYGLLYTKIESYDSAEYYFDKAIYLGKRIDDFNGITKSMIELADVELAREDIQAADDLLAQSLVYARKVQSHKWLKEIYERLHKTARQRGDLNDAIQFYDRYIEEKDSIFNEQTLNNIARLESELAVTEQKRQLELKESEILILEQRTEIQRTRIVILIIVISTIVLVSFFVIRNRQLSAQKKEEKAKKEADQVKQELESKNRELISYTINFVQKNQLFEELMDSVQHTKKHSSSEIRKELIGMERTIKKHLQVDRDWEDFKLRFENLHSGFFDKILGHEPSLTGNDLKLCALVKMNFSIKEIADMMGISTESVKTARYRLKKKLQLPSEMSVNDFLNSVG